MNTKKKITVRRETYTDNQGFEGMKIIIFLLHTCNVHIGGI